jgi:hypothetical protein
MLSVTLCGFLGSPDANSWKQTGKKPGVVVHTCNPSTQEVKAGGAQVCDYLEKVWKPLFQKTDKK